MSYGVNPNESYMSESGMILPKEPEIYLNVGPYAIWWTGSITGVPYGDDCIAWTAPMLVNTVNLPVSIDIEGARPISAIECWDGTMWADRPEGPSKSEIARICDEVRSFTLLASKFAE